MRRALLLLRRRLFNIAATVSLVLCVATTVAWSASPWIGVELSLGGDFLPRGVRFTSYAITGKGRLHVGWFSKALTAAGVEEREALWAGGYKRDPPNGIRLQSPPYVFSRST